MSTASTPGQAATAAPSWSAMAASLSRFSMMGSWGVVIVVVDRYWCDVDLESVRPLVTPHRLHHLQAGGGEALPRPQAGHHRQRAVAWLAPHTCVLCSPQHAVRARSGQHGGRAARKLRQLQKVAHSMFLCNLLILLELF